MAPNRSPIWSTRLRAPHPSFRTAGTSTSKSPSSTTPRSMGWPAFPVSRWTSRISPPLAAYTFNDQQLLAMLAAKLNAGENDNGVSFTLRGAAGKGLLLWVDDSTGTPVLKQTVLP